MMLKRVFFLLGACLAWSGARGAERVYIVDVPDYYWHAGCFGTASGNLMGFWDRNGYPNFYTGPTSGGVAPLTSNGSNAGIRALWASQAGVDGRPANQPGHMDDYYIDYELTLPDPHVTAGRPEHSPDSIGDFIGLNQMKWQNLNSECDGNIDGFSFVYWDRAGERRVNFQPGIEAGEPATDIPSGLRAWTAWRGEDSQVFSQVTDYYPGLAPGKGFSFDDLKAEIDRGYPVLLFLQHYSDRFRAIGTQSRANPNIHGMLAYGYLVTDSGRRYVRFRTSWGSGNNQFGEWLPEWNVAEGLDLPVMGVIGYHPIPRITSINREGSQVRLAWHGPAARILDESTGATRSAHWYAVERSSTLAPGSFTSVGEPTDGLTATVDGGPGGDVFFRIRLLER